MGYRSYALGSQPKWLANYISSLKFDVEICPYVLDVLVVHVRELARRGFLRKEEAEELIRHIERFNCTENFEGYEDIHEAIEYYLIKRSSAAKQLNLGKSRNDQVATAIRLKLRDELLDSLESVYLFTKALYVKAKLYKDVPFPTFTHLQPAQPANLGLYFSSFAEELVDALPLVEATLDLVNKCPLGAAAAAGSTVPLDRSRRCEELCFDEMALNTLYATTTRSFLLAALSFLATLSIPLLRFTEDMFVFSTPSFGLVAVPDEHAGTSSIMPHKRNPATLEVARAELSKLLGYFSSAFVILKGLPSGYCLDLQQLTPLAWEAFKAFRLATLVLTDFVEKVEINVERVSELMKYPLQAADVAEYLSVAKGVPFREAYAIVAKAVKEAGYDIESIAKKVLGEEAAKALEDPVGRRKAPGAPGNLGPVFEKVSKGIEKMLEVLERRYLYQNCLNS